MKHLLLTIFFAVLAASAFAQAEQTMYWIGGRGSWSDLSHWSYQSGTQDPLNQPSSVPTATTNVIIDGNSGLTGTGTTAARQITVNISPVIKSLTFTAGSNACLYNSGTRVLRVTGDITLQANTTIRNISIFCIAMEPGAGETSTLTTNGNPLSFYLGKSGQGTTNVVGDNITGVSLQVLGGTLNFNGLNWTSAAVYAVNDGTVLNMPNVTVFDCTDELYIGGTKVDYNSDPVSSTISDAQLNLPKVTTFNASYRTAYLTDFTAYVCSTAGLTLPLCTTFTVGEVSISDPSFLSMPVCTTINGRTFSLTSTVPHSFPALETLTLTGDMRVRNDNASLALGANGTVVSSSGVESWGTLLNADKSEFHITYAYANQGQSGAFGRFVAKDGTQVDKVIVESPLGNAYIGSRGTYSPGLTINEVTFVSRGGTFSKSMTIGTLTVAPSATYTITGGQTLTLTNDLIGTTPDCETYWQLVGTSAGTAAPAGIIDNSTGHDIGLENVQVSRITAAGANAVNVAGIDNGFNTNITFASPAAKTLYWVGRAGDDQWHTLQNWALTSGGSDYCMPTQYDDIVFDQNSVITGTAITVTGANAYFHDITIRDNCPKTDFSILPSPQNATALGLYCYGSWYMKPGVSVHPSVYFMSGDKGETITSNTSTFSDIYFTGLGGWTLADDLKTTCYSSDQKGIMYHRNGTFNTNGHKVDIATRFIGNEASQSYRKLILGSSEITLRGTDTGNTTTSWAFGCAVTDTLDAGTSTIIFDPKTATYPSLLTAYSSARTTGTGAGTDNGALNPAVIARNDALGTLRYHNIVFKGLGTNGINIFGGINVFGYTSSLTQFEANSVRAENKSVLSFTSLNPITGSTTGNVNWVRLDSFYAAPFSTVNVPSPSSSSTTDIRSTAQLTINESMEIPTPDCFGFSILQPIDAAYPATISSAVDINIPNVQMTNVKSTGGGNFTASGVDNGGNDGWTFTERPTKDLYWIGAAGDGQWNTPTNWTTYADGTPDGGCVPARTDNVHFNQYSVVPANKTITVESNDANFNNFIAEAGTPSGIIIRQNSVQMNSYGNLFQTGENMQFTANNTSYPVTLSGLATDAQLINGAGSSFDQLTVNGPGARWTFRNNMKLNDIFTISAVAELTLDMDKFTGYRVIQSTGIVNMADSISLIVPSGLNDNTYSYTLSGTSTLNADNTVWNLAIGFNSTRGTRTLNIRNAQIFTGIEKRINSIWNYSGTGATLNAEGSHITVSSNFTGLNGQRYGIVETIDDNEDAAATSTITGNLSFQKLILSNDQQTLAGTNTIDTLLLRPKGATLYLANGLTQTVNELMQLSGSPCLQNTLRAGTPATESGATQNSATASINYLNTAGVNAWDQVMVGGILATGDSLKFAGNSSNYGLNNGKVVFYGEPGLVGLPDNISCAPKDVLNTPQGYMLSAKEFYGTDLSTYEWYRRNANGKDTLSVPSTAVEIDLRNFGLDNTYEVKVVYDSTATVPCQSKDEFTISSQAPLITFDNGTKTDTTWTYCETSTFRVSDLETKIDSVSEAYTNTVLFDTIRVYDAATGGNLLSDTLTLANGGDYYLENVTTSGCTSPVRSHIAVVISDMPTADAGPNQNSNPLNPFTMTATATGGTGQWTLVSGEAAIADPSSPTTTVQLINNSKQAVLRWTVTNGACNVSVLVTIGKSLLVPRANPGMRVRVQ